MKSYRVLIVDDHEMVTQALARMLRTESSFESVHEATNWEDAIQLARQQHFELVLMDVQLSNCSGFDLASQMARQCRQSRILFVTGRASSIHIRQVLMQSAAGLILKGCNLAFLIGACVKAARGEQVFSPELQPLVDQERQAAELGKGSMTGLSALSPRQLEVARHLADGYSIKEVAARMHLSAKTVDSHNTRIMKALGIRSRVELTKIAIREGLVCS